ncbi:MAG: universal stress protein [Bacteroidetes bacterium]|nr:universal stress protein [Bacteroidota bacterium]
MNTILLPTDFSESSMNSVKYGLEIAKALKTDVIIFHANHVPVIAPNTPVGVYDNLIINDEQKQKESLNKMKDRIYSEIGISETEVPVRCIVKLGFAVDEIVNVAEDEKVGLIVIGTQGATGLQKALIGSNAASVIKSSKVPVLSIPFASAFNGIKKIALATDFHHIEDKEVVSPLLEIALLFNAEVLVFNVRKDKAEVPTFEQAAEGLDLEEALKSVIHSFHISENENAIMGIEGFVKGSNADILAMIPRKQSFWANLFSTSYTEEIALDALVPLLILPETKD